MPIEIYLYGLAFFILGIALGCALIYGCRYVGRRMSNKGEKRG
jgi:hypothetical protein